MWDILGLDFETFVLVLPDRRCAGLQQLGRELLAGKREQPLGFLRRVLKRLIVIPDAPALTVFPVRHRVNGGVFLGPRFQVALQRKYQSLAADLVEELPGKTAVPSRVPAVRRHGSPNRQALRIELRVAGGSVQPQLATTMKPARLHFLSSE